MMRKRSREEETNENDVNHVSMKREKKNEVPSFLLNLYEILEDNEWKNIIEWGENGKFFVIKNMTDFTEKVIPKYWRHNNFASFVRQVWLLLKKVKYVRFSQKKE